MIYDYADWCCQQPEDETESDDLRTVVAVSFYEYIPEVEAAVKDLPRWFKFEDILTMREIFSYRVGVDGFEAMLAAFPKSQCVRQKRKRR